MTEEARVLTKKKCTLQKPGVLLDTCHAHADLEVWKQIALQEP